MSEWNWLTNYKYQFNVRQDLCVIIAKLVCSKNAGSNSVIAAEKYLTNYTKTSTGLTLEIERTEIIYRM